LALDIVSQVNDGAYPSLNDRNLLIPTVHQYGTSENVYKDPLFSGAEGVETWRS
jgi:hypothetical protein